MNDDFTEKDSRFLTWAEHGAALFSTCAKAQYMAIVVSADGRVLGTGYNGAPSGQRHCIDGGCPRLSAGSPGGSSYENCVAIHAEANALLYSDATARRGGTLYVNGTPCYGCTKLLCGSGIARLVYTFNPSYLDWPRGQQMLHDAGIVLVPRP